LVYDKNDKRLFVPKRFGIGRTLNFAHPGAWLVVALIGAVIIFNFAFGRR
jgi:uncharacterized membrane protein